MQIKTAWRWFIATGLVAAGAWLAVAQATNYSLWINGRTGGGTVGNHADFRY